MLSARVVRGAVCAVAVCAVAVLVASSSDARPAAAGDSADGSRSQVRRVETLYAEGAALFSSGNYQKALPKFKEAYAITPAANLLFNIARTHEAMGSIEAAIVHYEMLVERQDVTGEAFREGRRRLMALQKAKDGARQQGSATATGAGGVGATAIATQPAEGAITAASVEPSRSSLRIWKWVAFGTGAALATAGAVVLTLGIGDENKITDDPGYDNSEILADHTRQEALDLQASAESKKAIGIALLGVSGAAFVCSAVLFVLDHGASSSEHKTEDGVAWGLAPTVGGGSLSIAGSF